MCLVNNNRLTRDYYKHVSVCSYAKPMSIFLTKGDDLLIYGSSSHQWDCLLVNDDKMAVQLS